MSQLKSLPPYIMAIDVGTSSLRVLLFDREGHPVEDVFAARQHRVTTTSDGGAELDADQIVENVVQCLEEALAQLGGNASSIAAVSICTFWHSVLAVDESGDAITPVYLWHDTRSALDVEVLKSSLDERSVHARTGCLFHTSYLPGRLRWLARTRPDTFRRARQWLSPGEYMFLKLFGKTGCSLSMASGTGLLNQQEERWDEELLELLSLSPDQLAPLCGPGETFQGLREPYKKRLAPLANVPWFPALGDGACSNVGSGCTGPDRAAIMVGTSGAMRVLPSQQHPAVPFGLWCYRLDAKRPLLGGALSNGGNLFQWLNESLHLPPLEELNAALAATEPDAHGLTVLPFFAGERSPGWASTATGAIVGLRLHTKPLDIVQACLEAISFRFHGIFSRLQPLVRPDLELVATGGALIRFPAWLQMMSDVLGRPVRCSSEPEASLRGAALVALESLGFIPHIGAVPPRLGDVYEPRPERHAIYRSAIERQARLYEQAVWRFNARGEGT